MSSLIHRVLLGALTVFSTSAALANFENCPYEVLQNPEYRRSLNFLRPLEGKFKLGQCEIEIHVCQEPTVADVLMRSGPRPGPVEIGASLPPETAAAAVEAAPEAAPVVASEAPDSIVGDILVRDKSGHESYIPLYFPTEMTSPSSRVQVRNGRILFHYEYRDRLPDAVAGRTESILFEVVKRRRHAVIRRLEAGMYTTKAFEARDRRYDTRWTVCEEPSAD